MFRLLAWLPASSMLWLASVRASTGPNISMIGMLFPMEFHGTCNISMDQFPSLHHRCDGRSYGAR